MNTTPETRPDEAEALKGFADAERLLKALAFVVELRLGVSFNQRHLLWTVQTPGQVLGNVGYGATWISAVESAMEWWHNGTKSFNG